MYPEANCRFAQSHEWVFVAADVATVGISNHAQKEISDIVFIELPKVGAPVTQGKPCAVIESVKAAADFFAPVSGVVTEVNSAIVANPALVNQEPHGGGWFFRIKMTQPAEVDGLLTWQDYQASCG